MNDTTPRKKPGTLMLLINAGLSFLLPFIGVQLLCTLIPMGPIMNTVSNGPPPRDEILSQIDRMAWYLPVGFVIGALLGVANAVLYVRRNR